MSLEAMIKAAEKSLGLAGRPNRITSEHADRNGNYYRSAPWCAMAVTYWARHSGNYEAVCFGKDYAYTVYHAQRFEAAGQWYTGTDGIRRGDIAFLGSSNAIDHVGIVTDINGRDVLTIEGNSADRCARRVRQVEEIVGYGRPEYAAAATPKPDPADARGSSDATAPTSLRIRRNDRPARAHRDQTGRGPESQSGPGEPYPLP